MRLSPGGGGWMHCQTEWGRVSVRFHLADDGRLTPWQLFIEPPDESFTLTEARLRDVPLSEIEAAANGPEFRERMIEGLDAATALKWHRTVNLAEPQSTRRRPTGKLPKPAGNKYPDSFYRRAADEYARLVTYGDRSPATTIAEANGVPPSTAHRWIKEARRRGFLPAGRKGRAG